MIRSFVSKLRNSPHTPAVCILLGANILFFFRLWFSTHILHGSGTDVVSFQYPMLEWARGEILSGHFPHWNPHIWGGHPFHAMGQAGLAYPPNWLLMLPGAFAWIKLSVAVHCLLGSLLAYALAFQLVRSGKATLSAASAAAVIAGLVYGYSGFAMGHAYAGHINLLASSAWVPGIWLGLWQLTRPNAKAWRSVVWLAVCVGMVLLAGSPQVLVTALLPGGLWTAGLLLSQAWVSRATGGLKFATGRFGLLALAVMLGLCLAAVQLLPMIRLLGWSARGGVEGQQLALSYSMPWSGAFGLAIPRLFGDPLGFWWAKASKWEFAAYCSLTALLLAVVAVVFRRRKAAWLAAIALFSFWLAVGGNGWLYPAVVKVLPFLAGFRVPARFVLSVILVLGLLASIGWAAVLDGRVERNRLLALGGVVLGIAALFLLAFSRSPAPGFWAGFVEEMARGEASAQAVTASALAVRFDLIKELLFAAATLGLFGLVAGNKKTILPGLTRWLPAVALVLLLWSSGHGMLKGSAPALYRVPQSAARLLEMAGDGQRLAYFEGRGWNKVMQMRRRNIGGYDPSLSANMNMFINAGQFGERGVVADKVWALWPTRRTHTPTKFWDIAGVKHVVTSQPGRFEKAAWQKQASDSVWDLYVNPRAAPLAYCPQKITAVQSLAEAARAMWARDFFTGKSAVLQGEAEAAGASCSASLVEGRAELLGFQVKASGPALLVVGSAHHPEWRCRVDGKESAAHATNLVDSGCFVPAGSHRVELVFTPVTFWWGLALSLLTMALLTAGSFVLTLRAKSRRNRDA